MQTNEAHALGRLAGDAIAGTVSAVEGLERAIFARSAAAGGPPTKAIHDGVAGAVYAGVCGRLPSRLSAGDGLATDVAFG